MAFTPIDINTIKVGDPITKELLDIIKYNFDDIDSRLVSSATTGGAIHIFNGDISLKNFLSSDPYIFYYKIPKNCIITEVRIQLFSKNSISSGSLAIDVQKSVDTNNANFNSILTTGLSFNFATDANYAQKTASINSSVSSLSATNVIRVEVTSIPSTFSGKFLLYIGAE